MALNKSKKVILHLAAIAVFALIVMSAAFYRGMPTGNDFGHHFQLAQIVHDSVAAGDFYPDLSSSANGGYGDFTIRFYPPFSYYFLSFLFTITGDWYYAGIATFFLIFFIGGIGAYFLAREYFSADEALITAAIYTFAPYHINQIYNNFLYAEFAATAIIPFCFLFVSRICRRGKISDVVGLAVSYSLLILTHLPMTVIGSLTLGICALMLLKKDNLPQTILKLSGSVALAALASSFYWLRMMTEISFVNLSVKSFYAGVYDYRENFLLTPQNILNFETDALCLWLADLMLAAVILASLPAIFFLIKERKSLPRFISAFAVILLVSIFITTPLSKFIWDNLSFLQKVQFPWRWLSIVSISGAIFLTFGIVRLSKVLPQSKNRLLTIGVGFIFAFFAFTSVFIIKQAVHIRHDEFDIGNIKSRDFDRFWWTIWAKPEARILTDKVSVAERSFEVLKWSPTERIIKVLGGKPEKITIAAFYYPHWNATLNETEIPIEKTDDGLISLNLPSEESTVELEFREPFFLKSAICISAFIWMTFLLFILKHCFEISLKKT